MASSVFSHLGAAGRTQAQLDDKARIELIKRDRWIDYPRALQAMSRLEQLMETPQRERMPCMRHPWRVEHWQDANHSQIPTRPSEQF
ncbi:MAG: putative TniB-like transposition protein [Polaromonas sp.]|nr:putative TniB-like transposition protein [Polaromonas sp.]